MRKNIWIWGVLLLLPLLLNSCNDTDDVEGIFTGRTWKFNYIAQDGKNGLLDPYRFSDVTQSNYNSYSNGSKSFTLDFEGSTTNDITMGDFVGSGSVTMKGNWQADGKNNEMKTTVSTSKVLDSADNLGKKIVEAMKSIDSYKGDNNNLYLYFDYNTGTQYEPIRLCLVFAPAK